MTKTLGSCSLGTISAVGEKFQLTTRGGNSLLLTKEELSEMLLWAIAQREKEQEIRLQLPTAYVASMVRLGF